MRFTLPGAMAQIKRSLVLSKVESYNDLAPLMRDWIDGGSSERSCCEDASMFGLVRLLKVGGFEKADAVTVKSVRMMHLKTRRKGKNWSMMWVMGYKCVQ